METVLLATEPATPRALSTVPVSWVTIWGGVVQRLQRSSDNRPDAVEPDDERALSLHALDREIDLVDRRVGACSELEQTGKLGIERDMDLQVVHLQGDFVDREIGHVQHNVGLLVGRRGGRSAGCDSWSPRRAQNVRRATEAHLPGPA